MIRQSSRARRLGGSATARGPGPRGSRGWAAGLLAFGVLATAIAVPTCLGVLAVDVTVDLNLGDAGLGLVVSAFWAVTAVAAPVAGRWVDRVGWPAGVRVGALVTAACLASCALVVDSWVALLVVFAISGVGYGLCSPTSNLVVVELVPPARHASVLGMKQTAPPLLMAAAGVTLPWLAHLLGWRAAMAAVLVLPAVVLLLAWRGARGHRARSRSVSRSSPVVRRAERSVIAPMAVAAGLGTFSVATITGFAVLTLVSAGLSPVVAAGVVSGGSLLAVVVRVAAGRFLDTRPASDVTPLLAVMALAGITLGLVAVGVTGLDAGEGAGAPWRAVVVAGVVLALVAAWTWPALLLITVVRTVSAPGAASGTVQLGSGIGSAVGPSAFGALSDAGGRGWAWAAMAVATVAAMVLVRRGGRRAAAPRSSLRG
ncbi:MAG TPA: MFS transporter [Micromonosporaceae bacterium]|nr:MFS transporter [Micromonosporaceae bacterium]